MRHDHQALHREIRALGRTRDQLEPMVQPGPATAQELWEELEKRWSDVQNRAKHLGRETADARGGVADGVREDISELREGYDRLSSALRKPGSDGFRGQVWKSLDRLVAGGHRTTERVAGSVEDLADAARLRIEKVRLERRHFKKCTELGTRVYALAKEPSRPEGEPPQVLDDDQVKALLRELRSLDADLRKDASGFLETDRMEA
jgi:hypothetical protein